MPTQQTTYNSRITDEALEKRFRDTFRSQGGAELVDDLYAQGVIVPVVDFTSAASGSTLQQNLQTAWDFTTGYTAVENTNSTIISNSGFWTISLRAGISTGTSTRTGSLTMTDGLSVKTIWSLTVPSESSSDVPVLAEVDNITVFLRAGDSLVLTSSASGFLINASYRQIATVSGDLVNPSGFTSS